MTLRGSFAHTVSLACCFALKTVSAWLPLTTVLSCSGDVHQVTDQLPSRHLCCRAARAAFRRSTGRFTQLFMHHAV